MKASKLSIFIKIIKILSIVLLLNISIAGCNNSNEPNTYNKEDEQVENNDQNKPKEETHTIDEKLKDDIAIVDETSILKAAKEWFDEFKAIEGAYVFQHPDTTYIKINSKEQNTGGYSINIRDYLKEEYPRVIKFEIVEPDQHAVVTQTITYPSVILEISSDEVNQYEIRTVDGQVLSSEEKLIWAKLELPKENEEISNPLRVKGKIIAFEGSFIVRVLDNDNNLIYESLLQADAGGPSWGNFDNKISYTNTTSKTGSIELGEYSAEDGKYMLRERISIKFANKK